MRCGEVESKIGRSIDKFRDKVKADFITPLRTFLNIDVKNAIVCTFHAMVYVPMYDIHTHLLFTCRQKGRQLISVGWIWTVPRQEPEMQKKRIPRMYVYLICTMCLSDVYCVYIYISQVYILSVYLSLSGRGPAEKGSSCF